VSADGDEMPGHATRRQVIAEVLVPRGVRAGTNAGRRRQWPAPHCLQPKSDGPPFGVREKWRRSGGPWAVPMVRGPDRFPLVEVLASIMGGRSDGCSSKLARNGVEEWSI